MGKSYYDEIRGRLAVLLAVAVITSPAWINMGTRSQALAQDVKGKPVSIGVILSIAGFLTTYGKSGTVAIKVAEEDAKKAGKINGSPIRFVIEDSGTDPKQALSIARKLVEKDRVIAIVGPTLSASAEIIFPWLNRQKVPVISQSVAKPGVAPANRPWAFTFV